MFATLINRNKIWNGRRIFHRITINFSSLKQQQRTERVPRSDKRSYKIKTKHLIGLNDVLSETGRGGDQPNNRNSEKNLHFLPSKTLYFLLKESSCDKTHAPVSGIFISSRGVWDSIKVQKCQRRKTLSSVSLVKPVHLRQKEQTHKRVYLV